MSMTLKQFWQDEDGATAIEYGLIAGLVAIALIAALTALGGDLGRLFGTVSAEIEKVAPKDAGGTGGNGGGTGGSGNDG